MSRTLPTSSTPIDLTVLAANQHLEFKGDFGSLYVGSIGDLKCKLLDDSEWSTFKNVRGDFPRLVKAIHTDSTCSDIIVDAAISTEIIDD